MIRTIIIDDEPHCADRLNSLLESHCRQEIQVMGAFGTLEEGKAAIRKLQPDLVFLDVQLHDQTGFDLLKGLDSIPFSVIFTTAFEKYAVQAFRFSAIDYLLKPVDRDDLLQAIGKVSRKRSQEEVSQKYEVLFHNLKNIQGVSKRISVPTVNGLLFIQVSDIIRCQAEVNYTVIFLKGKQKITVARTLKEFEELLSDYNFFRVHNSHLINLLYIKSYNKGKGGFVSMNDDSVIEVSTRRKEEFLKKIGEL